MKRFLIVLLFTILLSPLQAQYALDSLLPVRGFAIASPKVDEVDRFVRFIQKELAPRKVNTLVLRVDYNYEFESHPELRDSVALSKTDVKKLVEVCRQSNIRLIPQINLLGHQSWANKTHNLLREYPGFDETPHIKIPQEYEWPNEDGLYCKSYCPLHPDVHEVVFALIDEICKAFEADAFHAGMDEVFYIGDDKCPRCAGLDKARLFAGEVTRIRNHLARNKRELWIWGDRLIDGKTTGIGLWEGSYNNTHQAIDLIPKDVVINDWHYEKAEQTAVYFAMKGFRVVSCPWNKPEVGVAQLEDMLRFRQRSNKDLRGRFSGVMQTVWSDTNTFLEGYYNEEADENGGTSTTWNTFAAMYDKVLRLAEKAEKVLEND